MTKKDYQAIARAIHGLGWALDTAPDVIVSDMVDALADVMAADNPRFDRARFVKACETGRCKGMPR